MRKFVFEKILYIALFLGISVLLINELTFFMKADSITFQEFANEKLRTSAESISSSFSKNKTLTDSIISTLNAEPLKKDSIQKKMEEILTLHPVDGLFFAIENEDFGSKGNYALLLYRHSGFIDMPDFFNDSVDNHYKKYYVETQNKGQAWWISPVSEEIVGERIVGCCLPLCMKNGKKGMIMLIYSSSHIYERLQQLGLSKYGLPYIMDSLTAFIAHPLDETRSLGQLGKDYSDDVLVRLTEDLTIRKTLEDDYVHINTVTGQLCNENFAPIDETGWLLGLSIYDGHALETEIYQQSMKRCLIRISLFSAFWIIAIIFIISKWKRKQISFIYIFPFVFFMLIVGTVSIYNRFPVNNDFIQENSNSTIFEQIETNERVQNFLKEHEIYNKWDPQRIVDYNSLYTFIDSYRDESLKLYNESVKVIPTGLYIHAIQFVNSYEIRISGIIWQKFLPSDTLHTNELMYHTADYSDKGILFPGAQINEYEQTDSLSVYVDNKEMVLYRWNFDINLPQQFSYSLYPFGKNNITIPLWSVNLDDNTFLIPDIESYKQPYPDVCPGLGNHFKIEGWDISHTYYSYIMESYLCNFGDTEMYGINRFPELAFNISISRKFIDSLVCKIIPIVVVLILLFAILFVRDDSDGFNNIIGCSGLFFVLVLDHINLRESVLSEEIMFLEYCYFFTYLLLLLVTLTSFRLETNSNIKQQIPWSDVLKRYFWTFMFGAMATTTIFIFY
jgi:hypothetical protein